MTSRSFEKERRSRDARRANVTPIRRESNCGNAVLRTVLPKCDERRRRKATRTIGRASRGARKIGEHERADTGTPSIASRHAGCQSPRDELRPLGRGRSPDVRCRISPNPPGGNDFPDRFSRPASPPTCLAYLSSTEAPASSSFALAFSASSFEPSRRRAWGRRRRGPWPPSGPGSSARARP